MYLLNNKNYLCKKIVRRKKQVVKHEFIHLIFLISNSFVSNCTRFYKMIKKLQYSQIFSNFTDTQLIALLSMNKKIIACTNLQMNKFERKLCLKYANIENMTQFLCLKLYRLRLFMEATFITFFLFLSVLPDCTRRFKATN